MRKDNPAWQIGDGPRSLPAGEIHVWRFSLDSAFDSGQRSRCQLALRGLLGRCLGVAPENVRLTRGTFGKPGLDREAHAQDIQFNMSHSGTVALVVLARGRRVGIDVQEVRPVAHLEDFCLRFFPPPQDEWIRGLSGAAKTRAFHACWTRREAAIKALGGSITELPRDAIGPMDSIDPRRPVRLIRLTPAGDIAWQLADLPVQAGYAAALCFESPPAAVSLWTGPYGPGVAPGPAAGPGAPAPRCRE